MKAPQETDTLPFRQLVGELVDVLHVHHERHSDLVGVMKEKKHAMVHLDHVAVEDSLVREHEVVAAIGAIEHERIRITQDIAEHLGKPKGSSMRLRELLGYVGDEFREEILDLRDALRDTADDLERLNELNRTLAVQSLDSVNMYLAMLAGKDPDAKSYDKSGVQYETDGDVPSMLLDRRI